MDCHFAQCAQALNLYVNIPPGIETIILFSIWSILKVDGNYDGFWERTQSCTKR